MGLSDMYVCVCVCVCIYVCMNVYMWLSTTDKCAERNRMRSCCETCVCGREGSRSGGDGSGV